MSTPQPSSRPYHTGPPAGQGPPLPQRPPEPRLSREELAATIAASRELGPEYEVALAERLADEVDRIVEARAAQRLGLLRRERRGEKDALTLALASLGLGIPLSAIAGGIADLPGIAISWLGIVGVNMAHALGAYARRRR